MRIDFSKREKERENGNEFLERKRKGNEERSGLREEVRVRGRR